MIDVSPVAPAGFSRPGTLAADLESWSAVNPFSSTASSCAEYQGYGRTSGARVAAPDDASPRLSLAPGGVPRRLRQHHLLCLMRKVPSLVAMPRDVPGRPGVGLELPAEPPSADADEGDREGRQGEEMR